MQRERVKLLLWEIFVRVAAHNLRKHLENPNLNYNDLRRREEIPSVP